MDKLKQKVHEKLHPESAPGPDAPTLHIIPLGDSITCGVESPDGNGYRQHLQHWLQKNKKVNVEFRGTQREGSMPNNNMAGWSAMTIQEVGGQMQPSLQMGADVVLVHIGTNDCNPDPGISRQGTEPRQTAGRLAAFLDHVSSICPNATIFVATIVGTCGDHERKPQQKLIDAFNHEVPHVVEDRAKSGKHVKLVDMTPVHGSKFISPVIGGVHPNGKGYEKMAEIWAEALQNF